MDGHDSAGARCDRPFHRGGIDVERIGQDVHEDGRAARVVNRAGGREEGERRRDDFVARLEIQCLERQEQRVGTARAADAVLGVRQPGDCRLELRHLRTHDEVLRLDDFHHRGQHLVFDRGVLCDEIQHRNIHEARTREGVVWRRVPPDS